MKSIILIGFMGSGKTTVGKLLSELSGKTFVDTDSLIEEKYNMSINEIFEKFGEEDFRKKEEIIFSDLLSDDKEYIIATGGGLPVFLKDKSLFENGYTVYLKVDVNEVASRLENDTSRPLLSKGDRLKKINEMLAVRAPVYENLSRFTVDAQNSPENIAKTILLNYKNLEI